MSRKAGIRTFTRAQLSAFIGSLFDYTVMIACTEWLHIHYTISIGISGIVGALVNFNINRFWTFGTSHIALSKQLFKFYLVVLGSIALKSSGTYFFTETFHTDYKVSRLVVDLFVSIGWNFMLQKYWVFRTEKA